MLFRSETSESLTVSSHSLLIPRLAITQPVHSVGDRVCLLVVVVFPTRVAKCSQSVQRGTYTSDNQYEPMRTYENALYTRPESDNPTLGLVHLVPGTAFLTVHGLWSRRELCI